VIERTFAPCENSALTWWCGSPTRRVAVTFANSNSIAWLTRSACRTVSSRAIAQAARWTPSRRSGPREHSFGNRMSPHCVDGAQFAHAPDDGPNDAPRKARRRRAEVKVIPVRQLAETVPADEVRQSRRSKPSSSESVASSDPKREQALLQLQEELRTVRASPSTLESCYSKYEWPSVSFQHISTSKGCPRLALLMALPRRPR